MRTYPRPKLSELKQLNSQGITHLVLDTVNNLYVGCRSHDDAAEYTNTTWAPWKDRLAIYDLQWLIANPTRQIIKDKI